MPFSDWTPTMVEQMRTFFVESIPFNRFLGLEVRELRDGFARIEVPFRPELVGDPYRPALHGGVLSALVDACGGLAVFTHITPPEAVSTIDLRIDYLRPAQLERVAAEATVVRMGNRIASVDVRVFHPSSSSAPPIIATGKAVYSVKRIKQVTGAPSST